MRDAVGLAARRGELLGELPQRAQLGRPFRLVRARQAFAKALAYRVEAQVCGHRHALDSRLVRDGVPSGAVST